jgi:hypothetical protein
MRVAVAFKTVFVFFEEAPDASSVQQTPTLFH